MERYHVIAGVQSSGLYSARIPNSYIVVQSHHDTLNDADTVARDMQDADRSGRVHYVAGPCDNTTCKGVAD